MKKICKNLTLIGSALMMGVVSLSVMANNGKIRFEGRVTDTTCVVDVNGQGDDALVKLPDVSTKLLDADKKTAGRTFVNFTLTGCTLANGITQAGVFFRAGDSINTAGRLDNTEVGVGGARNVELQILNTDRDPMDLSKGSGEQNATLEIISGPAGAGTAIIKHYVEYYATAQAGPGLVKSNVEYEIDYE